MFLGGGAGFGSYFACGANVLPEGWVCLRGLEGMRKLCS